MIISWKDESIELRCKEHHGTLKGLATHTGGSLQGVAICFSGGHFAQYNISNDPIQSDNTPILFSEAEWLTAYISRPTTYGDDSFIQLAKDTRIENQ